MTTINQSLFCTNTVTKNTSNVVIQLVQNNTRPSLIVTIRDKNTGLPIAINNSTVTMRFKQVGANTVKDIISGALLTGYENDDGTINNNTPYDVPGAGGRAILSWNPTTLDTPGNFQGEFEVNFSDSTLQSVYDLQNFIVRSQL